MKTVLRVFFTRFHQEDTNSSKYKRDRTFEDSPADVTPEAAKAEHEARGSAKFEEEMRALANHFAKAVCPEITD